MGVVEGIIREKSEGNHPWIARTPVEGEKRWACQDWMTIALVEELQDTRRHPRLGVIQWEPASVWGESWSKVLRRKMGPHREW